MVMTTLLEGLPAHDSQDYVLMKVTTLFLFCRGHLHVKPYTCEECQRSYRQLYSLRRHQRTSGHQGQSKKHIDVRPLLKMMKQAKRPDGSKAMTSTSRVVAPGEKAASTCTATVSSNTTVVTAAISADSPRPPAISEQGDQAPRTLPSFTGQSLQAFQSSVLGSIAQPAPFIPATTFAYCTAGIPVRPSIIQPNTFWLQQLAAVAQAQQAMLLQARVLHMLQSAYNGQP
eukprot:m.41244 g.41244  ORF g.41244 m.41244 type:complete len:229 (-) comp12819_c0_seq3:111-797(-)